MRDQQDGQILALMVPHVEDLLESLASMDPSPVLAEMTLVPDSVVGEGWRCSDENQTNRREEVKTVVRVVDDRAKNLGDDKKVTGEKPRIPKERGFDGWGTWEDDQKSASESDLWWSDEVMARRLAKYLQPAPRVHRQAVKAHVEEAREAKKSSRWSLFKKEERTPAAAPPQAQTAADSTEDEDATMTVRAEEVTFRRENEMGIWESRTGWGIVVRVRLRQS